MTYRDDEHSPEEVSHHAMVGHQPTRDALVPQSNGVAPAALYPAVSTAPVNDVLRGGMDADWMVNCLRRRWLMAICLGLVVAGASIIGLWFLFPESTSATALFSVSAKPYSLVFEEVHGNENRDFEILQRTQLAYLKSHFVLQAALRLPGIETLSALAGEPDKVQWLMDELITSFQEKSEILSIALSSDEDSEDLRKLVDAVAKAYQDEVVFAEDQRKLVMRDALAKSLTKLQREIQTKYEQFLDLAKEMNIVPDNTQRDPETELLLRDISEMAKAKSTLESQLLAAQQDYMILQQRYKDPLMIDTMVSEQMQNDPNIQILQQQLMEAQYMLASQSMAMKNGRSKTTDRLKKQIQALQQQISQYQMQMKQQMLGAQKSQPSRELQAIGKEFQIRAGMLNQQIQQLDKSITEETEKLMAKTERSVDLEVKQSELEQLEEIARDMSIKLESVDVEAQAPSRIRLLQSAVVTKDINEATRYTIIGMGGLAAFALTCLGVAYLEFRNRRLNGPNQVDEGLGIRVVGTLPSLSARRLLDPDHPIVAQLTESIDSVRTQLMHDSTSKRRQVVLVTSATTMEGRTTVASQLAASLARAGRRTLLVDGDVRSPALHALFDVPLEDGLCEVLRAEVDVTDVIRPTHAEGLWLLTAGYCDIDAIHALATEQMQPAFDKIRSEYDFIIIDGAPVIGMSDALIFGQYCDGAVLSVRRDFSQMPKINEAASLLRSVGVRLIGAVVNGVPTKSDDRVTQLRLIAPKSERQLQSA